MNGFVKFAFASVACSTVLTSPTAAFAKKGWMSCMIADDANKNAFYSEAPFVADDTATDAAYMQYLVELLREKDPVLKNAANARGRCNWDKSRKDELFYVSGFLDHFRGLGYTMRSDRYMPDPYIPR